MDWCLSSWLQCYDVIATSESHRPEWRNWQTRGIQNPVLVNRVWVRVPPPAIPPGRGLKAAGLRDGGGLLSLVFGISYFGPYAGWHPQAQLVGGFSTRSHVTNDERCLEKSLRAEPRSAWQSRFVFLISVIRACFGFRISCLAFDVWGGAGPHATGLVTRLFYGPLLCLRMLCELP